MPRPTDDPDDRWPEADADIHLTDDDTAEQVYEQGEELLRQSRQLIDELDQRIETWRDGDSR